MLTFLRFGFSGLPGFLAGLALNILLIERFNVPKPIAYVPVVWLQFTCGFLMCRYIVFSQGREVPFGKAYLQFAASMAAIRVADWCLYTLAVEVLGVPYVIAQVTATVLFIGIKFLSARAIFRPQTS